MEATKRNICDILGYNKEKSLKLIPSAMKNGYILHGRFLSRHALQDLMNNFHVYYTHEGLVCLTPGRLGNMMPKIKKPKRK